MDDAPFLRTKLFIPPVRTQLVPRRHLIERLDAGLAGKLSLVCAPAGFGKTTLLTEWVRSLDRPAAWVSLDERDNDPARFLTYLIASLQQVDQEIGRSALHTLQSPSSPLGEPVEEEPIQTLLTLLVNDVVAADNPFVLVLDDYHVIQAAPIHQAVQRLLQHQPPQMHLAIGARQDPPLEIPQMRARGEVSEIRAQDLRFTGEEIATLLNRIMELHLSRRALTVLGARTEGWIAGLQLAALSLRDCQNVEAFIAGFTGDHRYVTDYLLDEVLNRQPPHVQAFLLQTSILERMCGPLCDAVVDWTMSAPSGQPDETRAPSSSQQILEYVEDTNLFIVPLDNGRRWFRYHHLFADLLRRRLERQYPALPARLHGRASRWYEQTEDVEQAIYHAFAVPDIERVVVLIEQYGSQVIDAGRVATSLNWISRIPQDVITAHPYLCMGCGWAYALVGQPEMAEEYVQAAEQAVSAFEPLHIASLGRVVGLEELQGEISAIRAYCARTIGDSAGVIAHSQQALNLLPAEAHSARAAIALNLGLLHHENWDPDDADAAFAEAFDMAVKCGNTYVAATALSLQADLLATRGELDRAEQICRRAIELGTAEESSATSIPAVSQAHLRLAEIHTQRNELAAAARHLEHAVELARQTDGYDVVSGVRGLLRARLELAAGNLTQAETLLSQAREQTHPHWARTYGVAVAETQGSLHLAQGEIEKATDLVATLDLDPQELADQGTTSPAVWSKLSLYLLLARVRLAQQRPDEALALLRDLVTAAKAGQDRTARIEAAALQALACRQKKDDPQAMQFLETALSLAEPQGYIHPFLNAGPAIRPLLRQTAARNIRAEMAQEVLTAFAARAGSALPPVLEPLDEPLYESLTAREQQVLRLLAAGLSSTEVADALIIAVSTTRSYIKTIYRKLDVHSRDEAVARGRLLGLL